MSRFSLPKLFTNPRAVLRDVAYSLFFEGANSYSSDRTYIYPIVGDSKDTLTSDSRTEMLALARNLVSNVGFVRGAVRDISRYTVGHGINPRPLVAVDEKKRAYLAYWSIFALQPEITGKFSLPHLLRILEAAVDVDGDIGLVKTEDETGFPRVQVIEAHRIRDDKGDADFFDGVKLDSVGRRILFRVAGVGDSSTDIPAESFLLHYDPDRSDAFRGASGLAHALNNIRDKKDILGFEKLGVKNASAIANVITTQIGGNPTNFFGELTKSPAANTPSAITLEKMRGGTIPRLLPGEKIESFQSNRPSATFLGFLDELNRDVATGLGVPVEFLWDTSQLGGASQRFILEKAQRRFEERQDVLIHQVLRPLWIYVIGKGIARGELPPDENFWQVDWQRPSKITVDVGREADANRDDIAAGIRTLDEDAGERGKSWRDIREQKTTEVVDLLSRAEVIAKQFSIPIELAITLLQTTTPNGLQKGQADKNEKPNSGQTPNNQ